MEAVLKPPLPFQFDNNITNVTSGNLSKSWEEWKKSFEIYYQACEFNKKDAKVQISILLHIIGPRCREVHDTFKKKCSTVDEVLKEFDNFFLPKKNLTVERHKFFIREQKEFESVEQYVFELNMMAAKCEFKDLCNDLVKDRLICGIRDNSLRERLLRESDLTLKKALDICQLAELSRVQATNIKTEVAAHHVNEINKCCGNCTVSSENTESVDWMQQGVRERRRRGRGRGRARGRARGRGYGDPGPAAASAAAAAAAPVPPPPPAQSSRVCYKCGMSHNMYQCPAYGAKCNKCNRYNHYAKMCQVLYEIDGNSSDQVINNINSDNSWSATLYVNSKPVNFKLDTGADVNVLPKRYLNRIGVLESELINTTMKLRGYSGASIHVLGKCSLKVIHKNITYILKFVIADVDSPAILGRGSCEELKLVKRIMSISSKNDSERILDDYPDVFEGLGCLPGSYKISLKENIHPVVHAPRKMPIALKESFKNKLLEMEKQGIISKVEGPTDWVSSMTLAKKADGDIRVCLDPQDLNKAIKREHFKLPTLDEITSKLSGSRVYSTLDAKLGFWQLRLHDDCTDLCTFNTVFGRYKFLRMPFGISSASEVFHKRLLEHLDGLDGVCQFIDDLLIYGKDKEEHDLRLRKVLQKCREINIKLNRKKCKIGLTEITYLGHKISEHGISPDESHTDAIKNMPEPKNVKDLERFLGLVTYVGSFVPNLSDKTHILRELLKKDIEWHWSEHHTNSFNMIKQCLISPPVLQYYSLDKSVTLSVDASKHGLGACLLQDGLPVCYASKSLNKTEQAYAQIEKELFACVFACEKFYTYIYGRSDITIETDHKPLISIINKPIVNAPPRLQRMLMRLQPYSFKLVYKPGKYLHIADALSRAVALSESSSSELEPRDHLDARAMVCEVAVNNELTDTHFLAIQKCTCQDLELQSLIKIIKNGWPESRSDVDASIRCYWNIRDELTVDYGLVWKGARIVIPKCLRSEMLRNAHVGHLGIEKCKLRAREIMYWPNMNSQLEDMISNCQACLTHRKANSKETLMQHDIPERAWSKIGVDLCHYRDKIFLIVVDYYSKFIEVIELQSMTSTTVIDQLQIVFSRQGIPNTVMSDNGPEFSSESFKLFSEMWKFQHTTSSPRYPQSNGQVERAVQTVKTMLKKTTFDGSDFRLGLLEYLNTPIDNTLPSPAELLYNRKLRSILPCSLQLLKPKCHTNVIPSLKRRKEQEKKYFDIGAKDLPPLTVGQKVKAWVNNSWQNGTVSNVKGQRSYEIKLESGGTIIRNRRHIITDSMVCNKFQGSSNVGRSSLHYDDIVISNAGSPPRTRSPGVQTNEPVVNNATDAYVTRYGRTVRPPERYGISTPQLQT